MMRFCDIIKSFFLLVERVTCRPTLLDFWAKGNSKEDRDGHRDHGRYDRNYYAGENER